MSFYSEGSNIVVSLGLAGLISLIWLTAELFFLISKNILMIHSIILYIALCRVANKRLPTGWRYSPNLNDYISIKGYLFCSTEKWSDLKLGLFGITCWMTVRSSEKGLHKFDIEMERVSVHWNGSINLSKIINRCEEINSKSDQQRLKQISREDKLREIGM